MVTVDLMEKGKSGKSLKGGEEAKQPSGGKVPQAEGRSSAKALRQESTGLSHSGKEASQAGDTEIREEEEKLERCHVGRWSRASRDKASL